MGYLWDIIQGELDRKRDQRFDPPSERDLAKLLGVSPTTIGNWRNGIKQLPSEKNLRSVADFAGKSYETVLLAALAESGWSTSRLASRIRDLEPGDQD